MSRGGRAVVGGVVGGVLVAVVWTAGTLLGEVGDLIAGRYGTGVAVGTVMTFFGAIFGAIAGVSLLGRRTE